jgi:predicted DNA-binding protein
MQAVNKLIRKQYLISLGQASKLEFLTQKHHKSEAEVVRNAIDAYNPDGLSSMEESELLALVTERVKEAIADTQQTRERLNKTFEQLGLRGD